MRRDGSFRSVAQYEAAVTVVEARVIVEMDSVEVDRVLFKFCKI